ncbi:MAG: phytanoyl-CoA dioxygenase family protein [Alphaproteobacteria bacterium]
MRDFDVASYDVAEVVNELLEGGGAVRFPRAFAPAQIREARDIVVRYSEDDPEKVTHFQQTAGDEGLLRLQRRVWNLLNKGAVFSAIAQHPVAMDVLRRFLGDEFIMGSICASRLLPGSPGQEPHLDYPYWDFHKPNSFPVHTNSSFPLNAQATVLLDPFTEDNGATAYLPGSQHRMRYPTKDDAFFDRCARMTGEPGDLVIFFGATWHCAMPNRSNADRIGVLIEYLPKFVKPVEDMLAGLDQAFLDNADPMIRQLLGLNYAYPQVFDRSGLRNEEGIGY